jgi:hypothetical protein
MLAAVLIEPRVDLLKKALDNHLKFLPEYHLYLFTNVYDCLPESIPHCSIFHIENLSHADHGRMVASAEFWNKIEEENVLLFQHDSGLLREGIEEFYEYDFIGAPLYHIPFPCMNGGLSLRRKNAMIEVIDNFKYNYSKENEDIYFCKGLKHLGKDLPDKETALRFSTETIFSLGTIGYHAIERYFSTEQCNQIKSQYEEIRKVTQRSKET